MPALGRALPKATDIQMTSVSLKGMATDLGKVSQRVFSDWSVNSGTGGQLYRNMHLVNVQEEPDTNRDSAWVFQPELIVRSNQEAAKHAIFRRRPVLDADGMDPEREALEMIYRNRVEFAIGHGVAVHAKTAEDVTLATEVSTTVAPQYEVQVARTISNVPSLPSHSYPYRLFM